MIDIRDYYISLLHPSSRASSDSIVGDPIAGGFSARYVHASPVHKSALRQLDLWLAECNGEHEQCSRALTMQARLPRRLLDLGNLPMREDMSKTSDWNKVFRSSVLKLKELNADQTGQYIALSYCWGRTLAYKTTKGNLETHLAGVPFARLPKSLQDAILVTRYLDIRYIWIDCLCIVQDDKEDWEREAANMADIYSNAYLTIAASRASSSAEGFLGDRMIRDMKAVQFRDEGGDFQLYFHSVDINFSPGAPETASLEPLSGEPLTKRAWCLQERVLPIRTLHYGTQQMHWECGEMSISEEGEDFGSGNDDFRLSTIVRSMQSSAHQFERRHWYQLVSAYTSRDITQLSDRLPALSGVVSAMERQTGDRCYAGIWNRHFFEGLLWRLRDASMDVQATPAKTPMRLNFRRAPSWSWAAVEGTVVYLDYYNFGADWCAQLDECDPGCDDIKRTGESPAGYAKINAPITRIEGVRQEKTAEGYDCSLFLKDNTIVKAKVRFDFERMDSCGALMLAPHTGLAISPLDGRDHEFVRVGAIQIWKNPDDSPLSPLQHCEPRTVKLF